jgi:hypothetical protein
VRFRGSHSRGDSGARTAARLTLGCEAGIGDIRLEWRLLADLALDLLLGTTQRRAHDEQQSG